MIYTFIQFATKFGDSELLSKHIVFIRTFSTVPNTNSCLDTKRIPALKGGCTQDGMKYAVQINVCRISVDVLRLFVSKQNRIHT